MDILAQNHLKNQEVAASSSLYQTAWRMLVEPAVTIPVSRYLLTRWYGHLSASELMAVIGVRQAAFLQSASPDEYKTLHLRYEAIGRWSGLTKSRLSVMFQKESYLNWFFHRVPTGTTNHDQGMLHRVRINPPLSPEHQWALAAILPIQSMLWKTKNPKESVQAFLTFLLERIEQDDLLDQAWRNAHQPIAPRDFRSVAQLLESSFPVMTDQDRLACTLFEQSLVQRWGKLAVSHYFLYYYLPELTSLEAITLLLCRLWSKGDGRLGSLPVESGAAFARMIRADLRTARRILSDIHSGKSPLARFIQIVGDPESGSVELLVERDDPIHPNHYQLFADLLSGLQSGEDLTGFRSPVRNIQRGVKAKYTPHSKMSTASSRYIDTASAKCEYLGDKISTQGLQNVNEDSTECEQPRHRMPTPGSQNVDPLITLESQPSGIGFSKSEKQLQQTAVQEESKEVVVVVSGWNLTVLFEMAGLSHDRQAQQLIEQVGQGKHQVGERYIARLLWAYERKALQAGRGIDHPELYALRHWQGQIARDYLDAALLGPKQLYSLYKAWSIHPADEPLRAIVKHGWDRGLGRLLVDLIDGDLEDGLITEVELDQAENWMTEAVEDQPQADRPKQLTPIADIENAPGPENVLDRLDTILQEGNKVEFVYDEPANLTEAIPEALVVEPEQAESVELEQEERVIDSVWIEIQAELAAASPLGYRSFIANRALVSVGEGESGQKRLILEQGEYPVNQAGMTYKRFWEKIRPLLEHAYQGSVNIAYS